MTMISVVVPVYNVEKYIHRCVESILNQTYTDYEIILVDDGSTDQSGYICDLYSEKFSFIKTLHKVNGGLGYARNTGIEASKGRYITFIDSDDYITETLLEDLVKTAIEKEADTVIAGYSRRTGDEIVEIPNSIAGKQFNNDQVISSVLYKMIGPHGGETDNLNMAVWRVLYSLDIIKNYNIRFPSEREFISEDIIFDIYYYQYCKCVAGITNCGYIYCMNPGSLTERYNPERYIKGKALYNEKKRLLELFGCYSSEAEYRVLESYIRYSRFAIKSEIKHAKINGKKVAYNNIKNIISSKELIKAIKKHKNPSKSKIDAIIDFFVISNNALAIYITLLIGYKIRGIK